MMNRHSWRFLIIIVLLAAFLISCEADKPADDGSLATRDAQIAEKIAEKTYEAAIVQTDWAKSQTAAVSEEASAGTPEKTGTATATATITETEINETEKAQTGTPSEAFTPIPGDHAELVEVSVPRGTVVKGGESFSMAWRLKNIGTTTWSGDYKAVFVSGDKIAAPSTVNLGGEVKPGHQVDISMDMAAPGTPGKYSGNWKLRNADGVNLDIKNTSANALYVEVIVPSPPTRTPVPPTKTATFTPTVTDTPTATSTSTPTITRTPTNTPVVPTNTPVTPSSTVPTGTSIAISAPAPISPTGSISCRSSVRLEWSAVSHPNGIGYYEWHISSSGGVDEGSASGTWFDVVGLVCGETYTWKVRAVDGTGAIGAYSSSVSFTISP